jgi:hypothetical protein
MATHEEVLVKLKDDVDHKAKRELREGRGRVSSKEEKGKRKKTNRQIQRMEARTAEARGNRVTGIVRGVVGRVVGERSVVDLSACEEKRDQLDRDKLETGKKADRGCTPR